MALSQPAQVRDHWYWRPGWNVGTRFYTWHITFEDQPEVVGLAEAYRDLLAEQPNLDVIPDRWLHLTMQGIGFVDQVAVDDVERIVQRARERCAHIDPMTLTIGQPHVDPESIQIAVKPAELVRRLRSAIRAAIGDVWGADSVPEPAEPYVPHMSLAYINSGGPAEPLIATLSKAPENTANAAITSCQLIVLNRDSKMYVWEPYATVTIGG